MFETSTQFNEVLRVAVHKASEGEHLQPIDEIILEAACIIEILIAEVDDIQGELEVALCQ
jgi:hypothetical protein